MSIQSWQLYDFDTVETEFMRILVAALPVGLQVLKTRSPESNTTPRVQLVFSVQASQGQRHILNPNQLVQFQPFNTWFFNLAINVYTNRSHNSNASSEIEAKCREAFQLWKLATTWTQQVFTIVDITEQPGGPSIEDQQDFDISTLNFQGMFSIREGAWGQVA